MSISSRQVTKETSRIVEERMKEGYIPTVDYLTAQMGKWYAQNTPGFPTFKNRKMLYRKLFSVDGYNQNLQEIYNDLNNLYEELISQFTTVLTDFDYYETERRRILHQINTLNAQLTDLIFVSADTEGYVYSVHDDFIDRSKVDLDNTTCEINTDSGVCTLRESRSGITKLDMSHYFDVVNYPILAEKKYATNIVSNTIFPMTKFGYVFSDQTASWMQNIVTNTPGELQVGFIVDISPNDTTGELITRIEVTGQSPKMMTIEPLYSVDNINFVSLPIGYGERAKTIFDNRTAVWNFQELRARYIKFLITKSVEDEQVSVNGVPGYRYVIGFKHIELLKMGYNTSSVLYSSAFTVTDPAGEAMTIDKAALVVESDVQPGTSIDYFMSLGSDTTDDPTLYNWATVSATNDPNPKEQQVVDFKHIAFFNNIPEIAWDTALYDSPIESYYGIDFYKIYEFPYEPIKDSVSLYRGRNNWQVTPRYEVKRVAKFGEPQPFGAGDVITLDYPDLTKVVEGDGLIRGSVKVKSKPGEDGFLYNTPGDFTVNYSSKVVTKVKGGTISFDSGAPANVVYVDYQYDNEIALPSVYTTHIYVINQQGIDINHIPFNQAEMEAGQYTTITTSQGETDISSANRVHVSPGWHVVSTTAEPESLNDRFYSVNDNNYLQDLVYQQFAYAEKIQEVSWFELKYSTLKTDHSRYCIVDYDGDGIKEIVVNYRPQTSKWSVVTDDMLCSSGPEVYVLAYKFITTPTNRIYFKAEFNRDVKSPPTATATLKSYTIKLGY